MTSKLNKLKKVIKAILKEELLNENIKDKNRIDFYKIESMIPNIYTDNKDKGDCFEELCYYLIKNHRDFIDKFDNIYLWNEIPFSIKKQYGLNDIDKGIDIIALNSNHTKIFAIQCKFRKKKDVIAWKSVSTFQGLMKSLNIKNGYFMTNCYGVCEELYNDKNMINLTHSFFSNDINHEIYNNIIENNISNNEILFEEREYQLDALNKASLHYLSNNRGILYIPTGVGKTYISYLFIKNSKKLNKIIFLVPSIQLLSQSKNNFISFGFPAKNIICVGSELDGKNEYNNKKYMLKSKVKEIVEFLNYSQKKEKFIIFTTYHSSQKIIDAFNEVNIKFDLSVYDEAHHTTGILGVYNKYLDYQNSKIITKKHLFMTATPKYLKNNKNNENENENLIYSMDNIEIYGKIFYELSLTHAIEKQILCKYRFQIITTNNNEFDQFIKYNYKIFDTDSIEEYNSSLFIKAIFLLKSIKSNPTMKKIVCYHNKISESKKFIEILNKYKDIYIKHQDIYVEHIDSFLSMNKRFQIIDEFKQNRYGISIISNVQLLSEGIHIPSIDSIMFCSVKATSINIYQIIGRGLRNYENKEYLNIIIPINYNTINDNTDDDSYDTYKYLYKIISAIGDYDKNILHYFELLKNGKKNKYIKLSSLSINNTKDKVEYPYNISLIDFSNSINSFTYNYLLFKNNFNIRIKELEEFIIKNKRLPTKQIEDPERYLSRWKFRIHKKYKKGIIDNDQYNKFLSLVKPYNNTLKEKYDQLHIDAIEFIKNKKFISNFRLKHKNISDTNDYNIMLYIGGRNLYYKKNFITKEQLDEVNNTLHIHRTHNQYGKEETFILFKNFILEKKRLPIRNKMDKNEIKLAYWFVNQKTKYKNKKDDSDWIRIIELLKNIN